MLVIKYKIHFYKTKEDDIVAKKLKYKHSVETIREIMRELDQISDWAISTFRIFIENVELDKLVACVDYHHYPNEYDRTDKNDWKKLYKPVSFTFSHVCLQMNYELLREIVIHEYAHAWVDVERYVESICRAEPHGEEFKNAVKKLGGKLTEENINDLDDYTLNEIFVAQRELEEKEKPYQIIYTNYNGSLNIFKGKSLYCKSWEYKTKCKTFLEKLEEARKEDCDYFQFGDIHYFVFGRK